MPSRKLEQTTALDIHGKSHAVPADRPTGFAQRADRENDDVAYLYQPLHPAVLRTLKQLAEMAAAAKTPISICGDMAGDPFFTWILLGLGFRDLSMDPDRIPLVKGVIRGTSLVEADQLTTQALALESEVDIIALVRHAIAHRFPDELEGFAPAPTDPA